MPSVKRVFNNVYNDQLNMCASMLMFLNNNSNDDDVITIIIQDRETYRIWCENNEFTTK